MSFREDNELDGKALRFEMSLWMERPIYGV